MANPPSIEDQTESTDETYVFELKTARTFDDVNRNFDEVCAGMTLLMQETRENSAATNESLIRLATETSQNLEKLTADVKSVLQSQTMMLAICFTAIGVVVIIFKAIYDALFGPLA